MSKKENTKTAKENLTEEVTQNELDVLKKELELEKEKRLLALADFDNYKKRVQREREEMSFMANASILNILLDVMDDLNRGISDLQDPPIGLTMISEKVNGILSDQGIEEIAVKEGDKFDPKQMEAIGSLTVQEDEKVNTVLHIERKGYKTKDKDMVIRSCRVIVGKK